jgi:hypothetical protein
MVGFSGGEVTLEHEDKAFWAIGLRQGVGLEIKWLSSSPNAAFFLIHGEGSFL